MLFNLEYSQFNKIIATNARKKTLKISAFVVKTQLPRIKKIFRFKIKIKYCNIKYI